MEEMSLNELESAKAKLLEQYRRKKEEMLFAENSVDEAWLRSSVDRYRDRIKHFSRRIEALKGEERQV